MKTLIITLEYPPHIGGVASYIINFAEHFTRNEFVIYAPKVSDNDAAYDAARGWKVYRYKQLFSFLWPRWLRMLVHVYSIMRQEKITELHIHHVLPAGYVGWIFKKIFKLPYTIFLHGTDAVHGQKLQKINQLRTILNTANAIVVNSHYLKDLAQSLAPKAPVPTVVHPCPSDRFITATVRAEDLTFLRERLALTSKKVVLSVGRLVEGKGYQQFLELFPRLLTTFPNLTWVIVGTGPLEQRIVERARELQVASALRFIGVVPLERLRLFYALADVFVLLTHKTRSSTEAWGTVFLEAAAAELPVVAGSGGGVDEAVTHLKTGIVVDVDHPQEVLDSVIKLLSRPDEARTLGTMGRKRVLEEFTWDKQLARLG